MNPEYIRFRQQRSLSELLSITFKFLRENYKSFFKTLVRLVGPVFVLLIAAVSFYNYSTIGNSLGGGIFGNSGGFIVSFLILGAVLLLYTAVLNAAVFNYMKSYSKNEGRVIEQEVSAGTKGDIGKLFGLGALSWLLIFAGLLLFIIPGIYLSVPLSLATAVLVFRNEGISTSISESFNLVKDNWWNSFLCIFLIWLIVYAISMVFQIPLIIYTMVKAFTVVQENSAGDLSGMFDWVYLVLTIISSLIQYILYSILPITIAFLYFHLDEKKNFTGTYETIDKLGKND